MRQEPQNSPARRAPLVIRHPRGRMPRSSPAGPWHPHAAPGDTGRRLRPLWAGKARRDKPFVPNSGGRPPIAPAMFPRRHREWKGRQRSRARSEEHTSELQSLMRISYAVFCLKKKKKKHQKHTAELKTKITKTKLQRTDQNTHTDYTNKYNTQTYKYS